MKTLFLIHSYVDFTFFLPHMLLMNESGDGFDIVFLNELKLPSKGNDSYVDLFYKFGLDHKVIANYKCVKNLKDLIKLAFNVASLNMDYDCLIADHVVDRAKLPLKYILFFKALCCKIRIFCFVHAHNLSLEVVAGKLKKKYYRVLRRVNPYMVHSDQTYHNYLMKCGFKRVVRFPALKYSKWFLDSYLSQTCRYRYGKDYLLFLDNNNYNKARSFEVIENIRSLAKTYLAQIIVIKKKPRHFESILSKETFSDLENVKFCEEMLSAEQLMLDAKLVVSAGHSSAIISSVLMNKPTYIYTLYLKKIKTLGIDVEYIEDLHELFGESRVVYDKSFFSNNLLLDSEETYREHLTSLLGGLNG